MIDLKAIFGDRVALMATIAIRPTVAAEGNALDNGLGGLQDDWHDEEVAIETLPPCPTCRSLELWQDILGGWHCLHCDGDSFRRAMGLLATARRLRFSHPAPGRRQWCPSRRRQ